MSEIDADPVHVATGIVSENGFIKTDSLRDYGNHKVVWAPFKNKGELHTTKLNENTNEYDQAFVQLEGSVKAGSSDREGERVVVIVLDETRDK